MGHLLIAWRRPEDTEAPYDPSEAYELLRMRRAERHRRSTRFIVFGQALYERFAPTVGQPTANDAWVDGSEAGDTDEPVLTFKLNRGRHFDAAYQHAVVQARRVGLNIYDPTTGIHHLTDGRCMPSGDPIDEATAVKAWRGSDWDGAIRAYRRAIVRNSTLAIHDLAQCLRHGLGDLPVHTVMAGALMQVAAATDDARRRQRLATLRMIDPSLREARDALRDELRAAPNLLAVFDREIKLTNVERRRLEAIEDTPAKYTNHDWWSLWLQAQSGDTRCARRLAEASRPDCDILARPPWPTEALAYQRYVMLAAQQGCTRSQREVAEGLASGRPGWPHDPSRALTWLKSALAGGDVALIGPAVRLRRRLSSGWKPTADRAAAEDVLREAARQSWAERVRLLRRACELDHPEGWRQLGVCYLDGTDGLAQDAVVGSALVLAARKTLVSSHDELGRDRPVELAEVTAATIDEALPLCHQLMADTDPWSTIARRSLVPPVGDLGPESEFSSYDVAVGEISPGRERAA